MVDPAVPVLRRLGAESMLERLETLEAHVAGVRLAADIEEVHKMRVASRRLRASLRIFADCFPARRLRAWRKEVRRVTRALGAARDADVLIEFLEGRVAATETKAHLPGLKRLLLRLRQRRDRAQGAVLRAMDRIESPDGQIADLGRTLREILAHARLEHTPTRSQAAYRHAGVTISKRLEAMLVYASYADLPEPVRELHQMRIAAKRLRYGLEVFAPIYDHALDPSIRDVKKIQTLLGDLHDCDVWLELLEGFLDDEHRRTVEFHGSARGFSRLRAGVRALEQDRAAERTQVFESFVALWRGLEGRGAWDALISTLAEPIEGSGRVDVGAERSIEATSQPPSPRVLRSVAGTDGE